MNKKILITGAAKNVGAYLAEKLCEIGYHVILHYNLSSYEAREIFTKCRKKGYQLDVIQGDFSTHQYINKFLDQLREKTQNLDAFIHNVGDFYVGSFLNTPYEVWNKLIQTNLTASFILLKELVPFLLDQKGHIICMGFAGLNGNRADTYASAYSLTKQALLFMVKSFAKEVLSKDLKVNMISPGYLEKSVVMPKSELPMKRVGKFEDIFQTVKFLLNQNYITGQNIEVAGGVRL
jgi:NAD(P)-dependent dehydrogenase (short-subunit alcohol dehydrogenase family)